MFTLARNHARKKTKSERIGAHLLVGGTLEKNWVGLSAFR